MYQVTSSYLILSCTCFIWAGKLHWLDKFLLYTVTDQNNSFFWYPCHILPVLLSFGNLIVNPVHFLLTENIFGSKLGKGSVNLAFILVFKPNTHKLYIFTHCTNVVSLSLRKLFSSLLISMTYTFFLGFNRVIL